MPLAECFADFGPDHALNFDTQIKAEDSVQGFGQLRRVGGLNSGGGADFESRGRLRGVLLELQG